MTRQRTDKTANKLSDESFFVRWSQRKQEAFANLQEATEVNKTSADNIEIPQPTDADMPPIESLTEDSDYSAFLSPKVSEALRKQALHKLFHSPAFNICDGLDDYDDDYTKFEKLGNIVTADMKHQIEMEAQRRMQALTDADSQQANDSTQATATSAGSLEHDSDTSEQLLADADIEESIDNDGGTEDKL